MQTQWDLSVFYHGFDDPEFQADMHHAPELIAALTQAAAAPAQDEGKALCDLVAQMEACTAVMERLFLFTELTLACDATHAEANAAMTPLMRIAMTLQQANNAVARRLAACEDLDALLAAHPTLQQNAFALRDMARQAHHMLPEALEGPVLRMQLSGGTAFSQLRDKLAATLTVSYRSESLPLSAVRAMAYDADPAVRRDAYEAELAAYPKIELPMSACLNSIKAEGQTMAELRGYSDVLAMTLDGSRMSRQTLDAMFDAIREALPALRQYFKAKARLLGHEDGLPFYDLFAPVGNSTRTFTLEQARDMLLRVFGGFSDEMAAMMRQAFDEGWIDAYPRQGKSGGAFCAPYYAQNLSRVMTNFAGSLSDISTLAHELGHAFNNRMLCRVPRLMIETPMPLAETASTFNETLLSEVLRHDASPNEELMLLDASLVESTQTTVDIYSRFLFEQKVVAAQADHALTPEELKETMLWAQEQTYGDGLCSEVRHPYMWACKSHYYSTDMHFYNFPYAFGSLFARGLYARYAREGASFVPVYGDLLSRFGSGTVEDVAASVGIDVQSPDFWREAVAGVVAEVERFAELAAQMA